MEFDKLLEHLNEYQREAVLDESDTCLVNAHVGSGKTTVLTAKIMYLHHVKGISYSEMAVFTFTNKAADEIRERLGEMDACMTSEELEMFGTFHSVCLGLLRRKLPVETLGYTRDFLVAEPEEELLMAQEIIECEKLKIKYKNRLKKRLEQAAAGEAGLKQADRFQDDIVCLMAHLKKEKVRQNKMTFSDLIANTIVQLRMEECNTAPAWVIVDEVQDSDRLQLDFMDQLIQAGAKLFAVGDPNQVIYSWRGSAFHIFYTLKHKYQARELSLPLNYRSSTSILEAAGMFLQHGGDLKGTRDYGSRIVVKKHYDSFSEASYLADRIASLHRDGLSYGDIAVFYRLQEQSGVLKEVFARQGIPYEISVKKSVQDIPVLDWLTRVLRFSVNEMDRTSAKYVLGHKEYGEKMSKKMLNQVLDGAEAGHSLLYDRMQGFKEECGNITAWEELYRYFELDVYLKPSSASWEEDRKQAEMLLRNLPVYDKARCPDFYEGLREYMNSSALSGFKLPDTEEGGSVDRDRVRLMTLHASKGLEFSYVFMIGINDGLLPLQTGNPEGEEEERRLFFVGLTRAKDHLELSYYINPGYPRAFSGEGKYIRMIPRRLTEREDEDTNGDMVSLQELKRQIVMARENGEKDDVNSDGMYEKIQRKVRHRKYGGGVVVEEDEMMMTVEFELYGKKEFMKGFCEQEFEEII